MVERNKAGGRARTWPPDIAVPRRRRAFAWADGAARLARSAADRIKAWARAELGAGRLVVWLPIAFGTGIAVYFTAEREPAWWAGLSLAVAAVIIAILLRERPVAFAISVAVTAIAAGFVTAILRSIVIAHPILPTPAFGAEISGFVEVREERERSDRIVIRVRDFNAARSRIKPERVRIAVRKGTAPPVGAFVTLKARLNPPLQPLRAGGYDFARDLYFHGIGGIGFVLGRIKVGEPPEAAGLWLRYAAAINAIRDVIDARIRQAVSGDKGSIASALITGKRDAISAPVNNAMYVSSLAHVLSISGYHMAVVAGVVFFSFRALFALVPILASRYPIKKWAALAALAAATFYLLLSGAEIATQRSFVMTAIVLIGVMFDRPALTLRTIAVAAFAVLLLTPEAVVHPSFQMSFAATLALVAGYERGLPWFSAIPDTSLGSRIALWGGREIVGLVFASLLAGFATTPYAAYHFHRLAPYGVLANLLAMPVVSAWVMPAGLLALLAMPFGFDGLLWRVMGEGIGWMIEVALFVANLPGAVGHVSAFGPGPLLLGTAGLIVLCLLRSPLRWLGAVIGTIACVWALHGQKPDIFVSTDGHVVAARNPAGKLSILKQRDDDFTIREWLLADGDARLARDATLSDEVRCDDSGCVSRLSDGSLIALSLLPEALDEDCRRAAVVVTARLGPADCAATLIDRSKLRSTGAVSFRRNGNSFDIIAARPPGYDRPWVPARADAANGARTTGQPAISRDATPRAQDLDADD